MTHHERLWQQDDWQTAQLEYFLGRPEDTEMLEEYRRRGFVPTNNLSLYIVDDPSPEFVPGSGIINPYDYNQQPFGPMIVRLRTERPDLWAQAKAVEARRREYIRGITASFTRGVPPTPTPLVAGLAPVEWEKVAVYTEVITALAPDLIEAGISPLDLCI